MKEADIVRKIIAWLKNNDFWAVKMHGGPFQIMGLPDVLAIKDGRAFWFEVKTPRGVPTSVQLYVMKQLRKHGCVAEVVRSVSDVVSVMEQRLDQHSTSD